MDPIWLLATWRHLAAHWETSAVLLPTYAELKVPHKFSCADWERGDTIAVGCEILQPACWPSLTLKQVQRHVGDGGFVVVNRLNLLEAQSRITENAPRLKSRQRSEGHLLFPPSLILGHKSWACRWRTAFQPHMKSLFSALVLVKYLHEKPPCYNNCFIKE